MKRMIMLLLAAMLLLSLAACGGRKDAWQRKHDWDITDLMGDDGADNNDAPAPAYEVPRIEELYSEDFDYTDMDGIGGHFTYHVPQIAADTQGAKDINRAIRDAYDPIIADVRESVEGHFRVYSLSITWETYQYGNILSLVVSEKGAMEVDRYNVYLYDIASGQQLATADLLAALNISETAFLDALRQAAAERFDGQYRTIPANSEEFWAERREWTLSDENININVPAYADAFGTLYVVLPIGSIAGAGEYERILKLDSIS